MKIFRTVDQCDLECNKTFKFSFLLSKIIFFNNVGGGSKTYFSYKTYLKNSLQGSVYAFISNCSSMGKQKYFKKLNYMIFCIASLLYENINFDLWFDVYAINTHSLFFLFKLL